MFEYQHSPKKSFSLESVFTRNSLPEKSFDEELVRMSIYKQVVPQKVNKKDEKDKWNLRLLALQEWFIRCSWINKYFFLSGICQNTRGFYVLFNILKSIENILSKDVLESLSKRYVEFDFDRILLDNNRALNEAALNEALKEDICWFLNLSPTLQTRVILKLLRLGGGGLIYRFYNMGSKLYKAKQKVMEFSTQSKLLKESKTSKVTMDSYFSEESTLVFGMRKMSQLKRRDLELSEYRRIRGITEDKTDRKEPTEVIDYVQILPIQVSRKIISYLDEKSLLGLKKVGKYWDKMIDDSINEKSVKKAILGKINKLSGGRYKEKYRGGKGELLDEQILCIGVSKLKQIMNKNNKVGSFEFEKMCEKLSKKYAVKILDSTFFHNRSVDLDAAAGLVACSTPNNMVHFYSVRTGSRMNFAVYGLAASVTCLTLHSDRIHIIMGCSDGSLISKDIKTNKTTASFNGHSDAVVAIFATSSNLLSGSKDNTVKYFQLWSGLCLLHVNVGPDYQISSLSFKTGSSPWAIIGTEEGDLILVDINAKSYLAKVKLHADEINQIVHNDSILITGSDRGNLRTWNMNHLAKFIQPHPYYNLHVGSPVTCFTLYKNKLFCGCSNGTLNLISPAEGKVLKTIKISSRTPILGIKITEDNFCMKLIIWHEKGIEIRSFPLGKLSTKKKAIGKDNRESKQKAPTAGGRNKASHTVPVCFGKATLEGDFAKKAMFDALRRPIKETCCTVPDLRRPQNPKGIYCSDIFTEMLNMCSTALGKTASFKTFPRYKKP